MRTKVVLTVALVVLAFYTYLLGAQAVALLRSGTVVGAMLGAGLAVTPVLGILLVLREVRFGQKTARLAGVLEAEGGLPVDDLPRRPSGRADRAAADRIFEARRAEVEADPDDWRAWFRLALAYDDAGDRTQARAAARRAVAVAERRGG